MMRAFFTFLMIVLTMASCQSDKKSKSSPMLDWSTRVVDDLKVDSLVSGRTYLSVYSQIYGFDYSRIIDLSVTVSLRNTNLDESVYIKSANYFDSYGELIRGYTDQPLELKPMETIEVFIDERNDDGGTGANFVFEWYKEKGGSEPLFEAVMIATTGQQGISFTTQGIRME